MKNRNDKDEKISWWWILLPVGVLLLWGISGGYIYSNMDEWADRGTFGDMFGAVNALFSGLAFAGVIFAILLQKKELKMQREELEATREELAGQKLQMERQNKTMTLQLKDSTFFRYVDYYYKIRDSLSHGGPNGLVGLAVFRHFAKKYRTTEDKKEVEKLYRVLESDLSSYYKYIFVMLFFIDMIDEEMVMLKKVYANILKSVISLDEFQVLSVHCKYNDEFEELAKRVGIMQHLTPPLP